MSAYTKGNKMKITEIDLTTQEKRFVSAVINRFTDVGVQVTPENFKYVEISAEEVRELVIDAGDQMTEQAKAVANQILDKISKVTLEDS